MKAEVIEQETVSIATPKGQEIFKAEAKRALEEAQSLKVVDNDSYLTVGALRDRWGARAKGLFALLNPACQDADRLHSKLVKDRDECVKPFELAAYTAKQNLIAYRDEQDRLRKLEQARLELEAKKKAEQDALELAETLAAAGATEAAEAVLDEPIAPAPVILPPATPKVAGFSSRRIYDAAVIDRKAFLQGIIDGKIPDLAWQPDQAFLRKQAGAMKEALTWPGVRVTWKAV